MTGMAVVLIGLGGLVLGLLGRSLLPCLAASALAGVVLVGTALARAFLCWRRRQLVPLRAAATLAAGLALLSLPLGFWLVVEAGLSHGTRAQGLLPGKLAVALVLVVGVPTAALLLVRARQLGAPGVHARVAPEPMIWGVPRGGLALAGVAAVVTLLGLLLPLYGGWPPLRLAIRCHSTSLARLCLDLGADVNQAARHGWSPLCAAVQEGDVRVIRLLLDRGADARAGGSDLPPLAMAVTQGLPEVVRLLLEKGADPNASSVFGHTLCLAAGSGRPEVVRLLLAGGADPGQKCAWDCTAIERALGYPAVIELLVKGGVDPNAPCNELNPWLPGDRVTPLMIASAGGFDPAVRALLAAGADHSLRSARGHTALALAVRNGRAETARLLREKRAI